MRTLALTVFAFSLLSGSAAFAADVQTGTASAAPVFTQDNDDAGRVVSTGTAKQAPTYTATPSDDSQEATKTGTAKQAPVFVPTDAQ